MLSKLLYYHQYINITEKYGFHFAKIICKKFINNFLSSIK